MEEWIVKCRCDSSVSLDRGGEDLDCKVVTTCFRLMRCVYARPQDVNPFILRLDTVGHIVCHMCETTLPQLFFWEF
jgi:hypothetical protein